MDFIGENKIQKLFYDNNILDIKSMPKQNMKNKRKKKKIEMENEEKKNTHTK
jgi:hypothetical protein